MISEALKSKSKPKCCWNEVTFAILFSMCSLAGTDEAKHNKTEH